MNAPVNMDLFNTVQQIKSECRLLQELHSRTEKNIDMLTSTISSLSSSVAILSEKYKVFIENKHDSECEHDKFKQAFSKIEHEISDILTQFKVLELTQENMKEELAHSVDSQDIENEDIHNINRALDIIKRSLIEINKNIKSLDSNQKKISLEQQKNTEDIKELQHDKDKALTLGKFIKWLAAGLAALIGSAVGLFKYFFSM